jgi:GAF domain-containing protein
MHIDAAPFARRARELSSYGDRAATVEAIACRGVDTLGCARAGVARVTAGGYTFEAATDPDVLNVVERLANVTRESPALTALHEHTTVLVDDITEESRWPEFCARLAALTSVRSALAFYLELDGAALGVLAFYHDEPDWFTDDRIELAAIYADHATVALAKAAQHDHATNLAIALQTNQINEQQAFDLLRLVSQNTNRKLRDIAADVTHTGTLPDPVTRTRRQSTLSPPAR